MNSTYHIRMENQVQEDIRAASAGEAIFQACHRNRGYAVKDCFAGGPSEADPELPIEFNVPGRISFEIPRHDPVPLVPAPGKQMMCARYVQVGDIFVHEGLTLRVKEIRELPVKRAFYCESVYKGSGELEVAIRSTQLMSVTRPETVESVPST